MFTRRDRIEVEFAKLLNTQIQFIADAVLAGNCETFDEYKLACGQVRGLRATIGILEDAIAITEGLQKSQ